MSKSNGPIGSEELNPFDPQRLRIGQSFGIETAVRRVIAAIPVRKPNRQEFFRVHPSEEMRLAVAVLDLREEGQTFIVEPSLLPDLPGETVPKMLHTTITRQNVLMLWPVRLPDEHGRLDEWNASAHEAAQRAETSWVRIASNRSLGAYEVYEALGQFPDPEWPPLSFERLLEIAFRGRKIDSLDHSVLRRLRGEI